MKKRKTYEISVIDKTYSKIISDETKFYTSDTSLELVFKLKETEYTFDSAEIVLLNTNDKSLVTRRVVKSDEGFVYEFEKEIIAHYGEWKAQLMLIENGEAHVSSPIKFRIENDLYTTKPQSLSDVVSWVNLKLYAEKMVGEFKQVVDAAIAKNVEIENTFQANEQSRQTTFETSESGRNETFESNETTRQAQELEREEAETTRQQSETQRATAESSRVSAEEQRKIDHANRSAELAGKANKKQEDWITPTLLNGWTVAGQSYNTPSFRKNQFGTVELKGILHSGGKNTIAFNLPAGYNPVSQYYGIARSQGLTIAMIDIDLTGRVLIDYFGSGSGWVSLSNISFDTL